MSHPFCGTHDVCPIWPQLGWHHWNDKAIYVKTVVTDSVTHHQALGEAIRRWNESVGARILMVPDQGDNDIEFLERGADEWPFTHIGRTDNDEPAGGLCFNYDPQDTRLHTTPGRVNRSEIYVNRDANWGEYRDWVHVYAHEIGHAFGLSDHPNDNINSVMSYQRDGRSLLGPSWEDQVGIAGIYSLNDLQVRPSDLEGIGNISSMWAEDRYGRRRNASMRWRFWIPFRTGTLEYLTPFDVYHVRAKQDGFLGFGRFQLGVVRGQSVRWPYL